MGCPAREHREEPLQHREQHERAQGNGRPRPAARRPGESPVMKMPRWLAPLASTLFVASALSACTGSVTEKTLLVSPSLMGRAQVRGQVDTNHSCTPPSSPAPNP